MSHINPDGKNLNGEAAKAGPPLVHLYPGEQWHQEGFIVGNRGGLEKLRDAINSALNGDANRNSEKCDGVYVADGEGYEIYVIREDSSWQGDIWEKLAFPYTEETCCFKNKLPKTIYPWRLLTKEQQQ